MVGSRRKIPTYIAMLDYFIMGVEECTEIVVVGHGQGREGKGFRMEMEIIICMG